MSKKRIAITVLLSAILAFLTACCVLNLAKKPMLINKQVNNVSENQQSQTEQRKSNVQSSVERVELKKEITNNTNNVNKKTKTKQKVVNSIVQETQKPVGEKVNDTVQNEPIVLEEKLEENSDGIVIPVRYVPTNVHKYTYTPKRYPKKK